MIRSSNIKSSKNFAILLLAKLISYSWFLTIFVIPQSIFSQSHVIDSMFGTNGIVAFPEFSGINHQILQTDNQEIIICGVIPTGSKSTIKIIRLTAEGQIDNDFGQNGAVKIDAASNNYHPFTMCFTMDKKILVACFQKDTSNHLLSVTKIFPNGQLDSLFGLNGTQFIKLPLASFAPVRIFELPNKKLLIGGIAADLVYYNSPKTGLLQLESDGTIDALFADNGFVTFSLPNFYNNFLNDMEIDKSGAIFMAGDCYNNGKNSAFVLKAKPDGTRDSTFGQDGSFIIISAFSMLHEQNNNALEIDAQGKIVVAGTKGASPNYDMVLYRLNPNGTPDPTFGYQGFTYEQGAHAKLNYSLELIPNKGIMTAGATTLTYYQSAGILVKYDENGKKDGTYFKNGFFTDTLMCSDVYITVFATKNLSDGHILALSNCFGPNENTSSIFRLKPKKLLNENQGLDSDSNQLLNISPNPTSGKVYFSQIFDSAFLTDMSSSIVLFENTPSNLLNLELLPAGIYLGHFLINNRWILLKIVKI